VFSPLLPEVTEGTLVFCRANKSEHNKGLSPNLSQLNLLPKKAWVKATRCTRRTVGPRCYGIGCLFLVNVDFAVWSEDKLHGKLRVGRGGIVSE
jgi:hypothetical protein